MITADTAWEIRQPVHYRIIDDGKAARPGRTFYSAEPNDKLRFNFNLVSAENGTLVGIVPH